MRISDPDTKQALVSRLKRIEGQVRGVQGMVEAERDCREVLQQLAAIRSALNSASLVFIEQYASHCLLDQPADDRVQREILLKDLINFISKT